MKTVAIVFCEDFLYHSGMKTLKSLQYFHPEFKIIKYGTKEINDLRAKYNITDIRFLAPLAMKDVWEIENPDLLIKIGGDLLILGKLDEVLNKEYDCAAGRNDTDLIQGDESKNRPDIIRNIPNHEWVNADLICVKNKQFLDDYVNLTLDYATGKQRALEKYGKTYDGDCQSALNVIFKLNGYKSLILDPQNSDVIYNASGNWTGETDNEKPGSIGQLPNNWKSWKYIYFNGKECIMPGLNGKIHDRKCKVIHMCGGFMKNKLCWDLFNPDFRKYLEEITGFTE